MYFVNHALKGNLLVERIDSKLLVGNPLGDSAVRHLPVYIPPGYERDTRSFPLLLALGGLFSSAPGWISFRAFDENMIQIADRLIAAGEIPPLVIAFPDAFTRYGGSQYINSPGTGPHMDHVIQELLPHLKASFRVLGDRDTTAVAGKSSGGFGALRLAMAHPELFAHALSSAGDLHFDMSIRPELARFPQALERLGGLDAFIASLPGLKKLGRDEATVLNVIALSSCYSPSGQDPGFDLPIDPASGELVGPVFERWLEQDPVWRVTHLSDEANALSRLRTLYIEAGDTDEYHADLGARVFSSRLMKAGIAHKHVVYKGGHFSATWRWEAMLKELASNLDRA